MKLRVLLLILLLCLVPLSAQDDDGATTEDDVPGQNPLLVMPERPAPVTTITQGGVTLELLFDKLSQGRMGVLHVTGENVTGARLRFLEQLVDFFPVANEGYYGLLVADMDQSPRVYEFSVFAWLDDGQRVTIPGQVEITLGGFIRQDNLTVPPERAYLLDPQVERNEFAQLFSVFDGFTEEKLWANDGFQLPISSEITSPFGAFRTFNQTVPARHTGWDLRAGTGTPVMSIANGRVAFAGLMDIRGNYVIIDHGYGIYSGYAHLSQIHVTRGQTVTRGQIIGVSGNTGRSGGAHLHWEMAVNGKWVDSVDFMQTWLP